MENRLTMIILGTGFKFIGRMSDGEDIELLDAISITEVMTERGLVIIGNIIGTMTFYKDDFVMCTLDSKSPYYQNYYQTTSNIAVAPAGVSPIKRQ